MVDFKQAVNLFFKNYAVFTGRSSRAAFWYAVLFTFIAECVLGCLFFVSETFGEIINYLFSLAILIPSLALSVRRMHDIGKGGGWICVNFIPVIGNIWFIILCCQPSEPFPNRFEDVPENA